LGAIRGVGRVYLICLQLERLFVNLSLQVIDRSLCKIFLLPSSFFLLIDNFEDKLMVFAARSLNFDFDLIQKYDNPVPRYTSYPPATQFSNDLSETEYRWAIAESNERQTPLSLYFHIPFCQTACYFCGCNVIVTNNKNMPETYLEYLHRDIDRKASLIDCDRPVLQLHWGGGTPNYLNLHQTEKLWEKITQHFKFDSNAEISIEVNPRFLTQEYIFFIKSLGFNRISFGIQDFNEEVQHAVNRVQPEAMLFQAMEWIKTAGFESVNVDLIYGLPYQTLHSFQKTIDKTIELDPDRIAVFNFAYVPWMKPVQKNINASTLPNTHDKLEILQMTVDRLSNRGGYLFIGMDHFAKPEDELSIAQRDRTLKRNFQGYTTKPDTELFSFGVTSIGMLQDMYVQNHRGLKDYYQAIDRGVLPINLGVKLHRDDIIRRDIIMQIMSNFMLEKAEIEAKYHLNFDGYFDRELAVLKLLENDGLVRVTPDWIEVTSIGRLLVRNIAVVFDTYATSRCNEKLSKAI
jgi:oxygen-independent coproporphyrinogen-3 oxidase